MAAQTLWEYRVVSVGSLWGAKAEQIEAKINELGLEGWEVVVAGLPQAGGNLLVIAKRAISQGERRRRREIPEQ